MAKLHMPPFILNAALAFAVGSTGICAETSTPPFAARLPTGVTFQSDDPELQRLYDTAVERMQKNIVPFTPSMNILVEGGGYPNAWIETQPMGGEMFAKRDPQVALNNQVLFLLTQREDGRLPGMIVSGASARKHGWDRSPPKGFLWMPEQDVAADFEMLQGFCFAEPAWRMYHWMGRDKAYLQKLYAALEAYDRYLWATRDSNGDCLLETWCVWDTGEDGSTRHGTRYAPESWPYEKPPGTEGLPTPHDPAAESMVPFASMDVMSYSFSARATLAIIAEELGNGRQTHWKQQAEEVRARLVKGLWVAEQHACFDLDKNGRRLPELIHNNLRCMWHGIFTQEMADAFIKHHLLNPREFWTPVPLVSIAVGEELFFNGKRNNWSGQPQGLTYQRAIQALERYGHFAEVTLLGQKLLPALLRNDCNFTQQLDPFTGEPSGQKPDGYGPMILATLEYMSRMHGIHLDVERGQVWWSAVETDGADFQYTQRWGERTFELRGAKGEMQGLVDGRSTFTCTAGTRVVTDLDGQVQYLVGITPEGRKVVLQRNGISHHVSVGANEIHGITEQGFELLQRVPFDYPHPFMEPARADDRLDSDLFAEPPDHVRPGAFWDWLNGSITTEQITRDLEAMKGGGMRGAEIWDVAAYADPDGRVPAGPAFLGPESTRLIAHAIREGDRLGLELGLVASSGWNAGGSWIPPEHAGKGIYSSVTTVRGPMNFHAELPLPELPKLCPRDEQGRPHYLREVAVLAVPHDASKAISDADGVVDLSNHIGADGKLRWEVPAGEWDVLRFVCSNHGQQLIVPSPNSGGPMIDFFDPRATEFHLHHILSTILRELGRTTFEGTSFKTVEFDSMELDGFTPWSGLMAAEFQRRAGYSLIRFLPLLAGWKLSDQAAQERFWYDWRKLVSDLLIDSHYATARKFLASYGVQLIAESGGPGPPIWESNPVDGIKALGAVDIPRGEFWIRHRGIFLVKEIASAAHVYDKRVVDAESFTTWRRWVDGPLNHKLLADRAMCEGLNCFSLHTFASSPPEAGLPGWAYHAGTDINPTATWWPMVRGFMDYLARCSYMLRQGWFVADVCYYYGDQAPNFHPPLCQVEEKPLLDGLAPGHDYDVCSSQVILERMRADQGRIVLPDGMNYAALVLPEQDHIPAEVLARIFVLVENGATVIGHQRPTRSPGLVNPVAESRKIGDLADKLWGKPDVAAPGDKPPVIIRPIGKGRFIISRDRTAALREIGIPADFEVLGQKEGSLGPLDFIHRRTTWDEFYFITNKTREPQTLTCRFRVAEANRGEPEFWWPDSGLRTDCPDWKVGADGRAEVPVALGPAGSVFVVFPGVNEVLDAIPRDTFVAAETPAPLALDGPWQVEFPEGWGAPRMTIFENLQSWPECHDVGIRFFSGIATYRKTLMVPEALAARDRLFLELGNLAEIAEVSLNGKRLGFTWLPPFRVEVSDAVKAGPNELEIRVANLWANRLNGDSLRPESTRFTRSNLDRIQTDPTSDSSYGKVPRGKTRPVYNGIPPLMRSGLLGPVRIIAPRR